jgi:TRAP-type C4-dicarboxylate transport system permease small subunit
VTPKDAPIDRGLRLVIAALFALVVVIGFMQAALRYTIKAPFIGGEELIRYLSVWMILLGAAIGVRRQTHTNLDLLVNRCPVGLRLGIQVGVHLLILAFGVFICVQGVRLVTLTMTQLSPALRIPMGLPYLAVPVGGALMAINAGLVLRDVVRGHRNTGP